MNRALVVAVLLTASPFARADVKVLISGLSGCSGPQASPQQVTVAAVNGKYRINFHQPSSYWICAGPSDVIEWIRADPAVTATISTIEPNFLPVVEEIGGTSTEQNGIQVDLVRIGERLGPTTPTTQALVRLNGCGWLRSETGTLNSAIHIFPSSLGLVPSIEFPQATLRSDIRATHGSIGRIEVKSIEGTVSDPVDIVAPQALRALVIGQSNNDGDTLTVGDAVHVNIGDASIPPAQRTMELGGISCARDFSGNIWVRSLREPSFDIQGVVSTGRDLSGILEFEQGLGGSISDRGCSVAVRVGRTFTAGSLLRLPLPAVGGPPALSRLIVINASRKLSVDPGGQWVGQVGFGRDATTGLPVRLLAPDARGQYADLASEFGFGAVGLVPFGTYGSDSFLAFLEVNATTAAQRTVLREVSVDQPVSRAYKGINEHFYARVRAFGRIDASSTPPFNFANLGIIEYRSRNSANTGCWTRLCLGTEGGFKRCREFIVHAS